MGPSRRFRVAPMRLLCAFLGLAIAAAVVATPEAKQARTPEPPALEAVLAAVANYLSEYERVVTSVVSEETYIQTVTQQTATVTITSLRGVERVSTPTPKSRRLRSDLVVVSDSRLGWIGFRDVYEVDGTAVRDRDDRVMRLFTQPSPSFRSQAQRIVDESTRFNLNPENIQISRSINMPVLALKFLRRENQERSSFRIGGRPERDGERLAMVRFEERAKPRLISTPGESAARGTFWIEPHTGRVVESELRLETGQIAATIRVRYTLDQRLRVWLPSAMDEEYAVDGSSVLEGHALYTNTRQFDVATSTENPLGTN